MSNSNCVAELQLLQEGNAGSAGATAFGMSDSAGAKILDWSIATVWIYIYTHIYIYGRRLCNYNKNVRSPEGAGSGSMLVGGGQLFCLISMEFFTAFHRGFSWPPKISGSWM